MSGLACKSFSVVAVVPLTQGSAMALSWAMGRGGYLADAGGVRDMPAALRSDAFPRPGGYRSPPRRGPKGHAVLVNRHRTPEQISPSGGEGAAPDALGL